MQGIPILQHTSDVRHAAAMPTPVQAVLGLVYIANDIQQEKELTHDALSTFIRLHRSDVQDLQITLFSS